MEQCTLIQACEPILAENIAEIASELRLVNVLDLIAFVRNENCTTLDDLVGCAAELYFRPGAIRYAWFAELDVLWDSLPSVALNMEFSWSGATAFFKLHLGAERAGVTLQHVAFDANDGAEAPVQRFARALAEARRRPCRRRCAGNRLPRFMF
jgi:hypothetical protein